MKHISGCLNPKLIDIYQRAIKLEELNVKLLEYLPESLREHCQAGCFNNGCLTLITSDPVWASQLRYFLPELRDKLRIEAGIYQLASIKIAIHAIEKAPLLKKTSKLVLSENAREIIKRGGETCSYTPLKVALQKLAFNNSGLMQNHNLRHPERSEGSPESSV